MPGARDDLLVIEDDVEVGQVIVHIAESRGISARLLTDPVALAAELRGAHPAFITLDLRFEHVDGVEVLRQLGEHRVRSIIILISGMDQRTLNAAQRIGESYGLHILGNLQKPFSAAVLAQLLEKAREESRAFTESDVDAAMRNGEFFLEFQPKVRIAPNGQRVAGAEALARWRHPRRGVIPPADFIPVLEASPLMHSFTAQVLRGAIAQQNAWRSAGHDLSVAVNVSATMLDDPGVPERFRALVSEARGTPDKVILELTETGVMADPARSMQVLTRFRVAGFGLSMDDFGTGYSSMVQLHRLPFTELKVDRAFVGEMSTSRGAVAIVRTIVNLGHDLGICVCAEGIEDRDTHAQLAAMKCDLAQGYFYGRPSAGPALTID